MGFYPVCPGTDQYVLGAPYLPYLKLHFPTERHWKSKRQEALCTVTETNGESYDKMYITHEDT